MQNPNWHIIHIGDRPLDEGGSNTRPLACTSSIIQTGNRYVVVDPGAPCNGDYETALYKRTGLTPDEVDTVFLTHFHPNHIRNLGLFKKSIWLMSRVEIHWWQTRKTLSPAMSQTLARVVPIEDHHIPGIEAVHTAGHTRGSTSLMIETREGIVIFAGDAVMTFEHFDNREAASHSEDEQEALRSIDRIAKMADLVIPGHDNVFIV